MRMLHSSHTNTPTCACACDGGAHRKFALIRLQSVPPLDAAGMKPEARCAAVTLRGKMEDHRRRLRVRRQKQPSERGSELITQLITQTHIFQAASLCASSRSCIFHTKETF